MKIEEMLQHAKEARELSYSPYSKYAVGAVIVTKDDKYFYGANIENAAYPSGICAERCALFHTQRGTRPDLCVGAEKGSE